MLNERLPRLILINMKKLRNNLKSVRKMSLNSYRKLKYSILIEFLQHIEQTLRKHGVQLAKRYAEIKNIVMYHLVFFMMEKIVKLLKNEISKPLTVIINQMLKTGIFPDSFKTSKIVPLFKKGDHGLLTNYRPISLLPTISKVFERVIYDQCICISIIITY